jgi:predicted DNA repair protein MutK
MASGFFALLDDIAVLMDDVAVMGKVATQKTAGILGDDLAVNAEKASGFLSSRELPVLWKITKGSFLNKLIILPVAFILSAYLPQAVIWMLLLGGVYLAYEGAHKIVELFVPHSHSKGVAKMEMSEADLQLQEKKKIKSAIVTDFILSVEIIIIALGTVVGQSITTQIIVVSFVAFIATVGVYGIVALIVRMDDLGYRLIALSTKEKSVSKSIGKLLVQALPLLIKALGYIGTVAMLLVAGGIYVHQIAFLHELLHAIPSLLGELLVGLVLGFIALFLVKVARGLRGE